MASHPVLTKILCVALVAAFMLPIGRMIFPFVDTAVSSLQFDAIQAVLPPVSCCLHSHRATKGTPSTLLAFGIRCIII